MESNEKLNILKQLSRTDSEKASLALAKAFSSAETSLLKNTDYYALKQVLDELSVYGHRVHEDFAPALSKFLERLETSKFVTCDTDYAWSTPEQMQVNLMNKALELVENFRYFNTKAVVEILVRFSADDDESVSKTALDGLKKCAAYDIRIFYAGEDRAGLGAAPQLEIISYLEANLAQFADQYIEATQALCVELLSPSMEGTSWDYKSVSWSSGAIPACDETLEVRSRTITFLRDIFNAKRTVADKTSIVRALLTATEVPRRSNLDDKLKNAIESDTLDVLEWLLTILPDERFPVLQKIEHDVYWRFYHGISNKVKQSCLAVRDALNENAEYRIFRDLIGFESIFEDWEESLTKERDFSQIEQEREKRASEYVDEITTTNWTNWKERIFEFCKTESNDMATFPIFYGFLKELAEKKPDFAFELVSNHIKEIEFFTIPIYRGLWQSPLREQCKALLMQRINDGQQLIAVTKLFLGDEKADTDLLESVLQKASDMEEEYVLSLLLSVSADNYADDKYFFIEGLFLPSLRRLDELRSKDWVQTIWYGRQIKELINELTEENLAVLLDALVPVQRVAFQTEEVLKPIASTYPKLVLDFFRRRIGLEDRSDDYEAVPFDFHGLREPLSNHPGLIVDVVRSWYEDDNAMFSFRGGRLVANIYPNFGEGLEAELIALVRTGKPLDAKFILSILRNYHGQPFVHAVCRELVKTFFSDKGLMTEVYIVLSSTGVVSGEYGMAEAYSKKAAEIEYWLKDEDKNVREFAEFHIASLRQDAERERARAEESIELRKHQYGVRNEDEED